MIFLKLRQAGNFLRRRRAFVKKKLNIAVGTELVGSFAALLRNISVEVLDRTESKNPLTLIRLAARL